MSEKSFHKQKYSCYENTAKTIYEIRVIHCGLLNHITHHADNGKHSISQFGQNLTPLLYLQLFSIKLQQQKNNVMKMEKK
jgi:hypothetical protein